MPLYWCNRANFCPLPCVQYYRQIATRPLESLRIFGLRVAGVTVMFHSLRPLSSPELKEEAAPARESVDHERDLHSRQSSSRHPAVVPSMKGDPTLGNFTASLTRSDLTNDRHISSQRILYIWVTDSGSAFRPNHKRNNFGQSSSTSTCTTPRHVGNEM